MRMTRRGFLPGCRRHCGSRPGHALSARVIGRCDSFACPMQWRYVWVVPRRSDQFPSKGAEDARSAMGTAQGEGRSVTGERGRNPTSATRSAATASWR
jgi:hypothetical protein